MTLIELQLLALLAVLAVAGAALLGALLAPTRRKRRSEGESQRPGCRAADAGSQEPGYGDSIVSRTATITTSKGVIVAELFDSETPDTVANFEKLANGVYYLRGGSHHSVAVDQADHIVVIEGPQDEARSAAVIAKVKETIPGKPIRYIVNSHVHFDHSGGLRTYVAEGATVVTHEMNRPYYEKAWAAPRLLKPDRLARETAPIKFETFADKHVLTDGRRSIEIHRIAGNGHNDAFAMVYLPAERILIEVDAWAPLAPNQPPPVTPSPFVVNLFENIQKLKLDVRQIAALHGPGVATLADLRSAVGM